MIVDLREDMCHKYLFDGELLHERFTGEFFQRVLQEGAVFVDAGANLGFFSLIASGCVGRSGEVIAIEPVPKTANLLRLTTAPLRNVEVYECALGDHEAQGTLYISRHANISSLSEPESLKRTASVSVVRLDSLLKNRKVDVVKLDIEGYELDALLGAKELLSRCKPLLYFEYISRFANERGITVQDFGDYLLPLGYKLYWVNPDFPKSALAASGPSSYLVGVPEDDRWGVETLLGPSPVEATAISPR